MQVQRCPICRERNDVSVYVHGQSATCRRCGKRFNVDRAETHAADRLTPPGQSLPPITPPPPVGTPPQGLTPFASTVEPGRALVPFEPATDHPTDVSMLRGTPEFEPAWIGSHPPAVPPSLPPADGLSDALGRVLADVNAPGPFDNVAPAAPFTFSDVNAPADAALAAPASVEVLASRDLFPTAAERPNAPKPPSPNAPLPGTVPIIPGYACTQLLGRGGMGEVWKARQESFNRTVAVKLLAPTLAVEPDFVRRFERESNALATLSHPNVVGVYDRGSANGHWYFVMEYVEGKSLRDRILQVKPPRHEVLRLLAQVARAIDYAHRNGVVHRDLKPENILVDTHGNAKVADFGLAGMAEPGKSSLTMTAVAMGTAHYMAPEQRRDAKMVDGRADLYSLGVMLYELMVGELPAGRFPAPREKVPDLDARLDDMILRLLEQEPAKRPSSAAEVAELLERVAATERGDIAIPTPVVAVRDPLTSILTRVRENPRQRWLAIAGLSLLGVAIVVAIVAAVLAAEPARYRLPSAVTLAPRSAELSFKDAPGTPADTLYLVGRGWKLERGALIRDGSHGEQKAPPRAFVMSHRVDLVEATASVDVQLEPPGPLDAIDEETIELLLYRDAANHVGVRLSFKENASEVLFSSVKGTVKVEGNRDDTRPPEAPYDRPMNLRISLVKDTATATIDGRRVAVASLPGLAGAKAKVALGCVGRCRFRNLKFTGAITPAPVKPEAN